MDDIYCIGLGLKPNNPQNPIDNKPLEDYSIESLMVTINNIQLLHTYDIIQKQNAAAKYKMIKKLKANYSRRTIKNNVATSIESLYDNEIESCEGIISTALSLCVQMLTQVIKLLGKIITWLIKVVLVIISKLIGVVSGKQTPPKEKTKNFFGRCLRIIQGKESLDLSSEADQQISRNELFKNIISYAQQYIKTKEDYDNSSLEDIFFYKLFLIDSDPKNIKYACDVFNRGTTKVKEEGQKLSNLGAKILVDIRPTASVSSKESLDYSTEDNREDELERFGQFFIKSNIINIKEHDPKQDFFYMVQGLERSIIQNEDGIWMRKFYNIFKNGSDEMNKIYKELQTKQNELERVDATKLKDTQQRSIKQYQFEVRGFQKFISSYAGCIKYFTKYYQMRATIINKFKDDISKFNETAA